MVGLLAFAHLVSAQSSETIVETMVVTSARGAEDTKGWQASVSLVESEDSAKIFQVHIQESLARVPGMNIQRGEGQEYLPALRSPTFTGPGACGSLLSAQDGIPLRAAGFCNINELFEAHSEMASRIEVLRGPSNSLFGSNAMHGVINILSPALSPPSQTSLQLTLGGNQFAQLRFGGHTLFGTRTVGTAVTLAQDGGFRDNSGYDQQKVDLYVRDTYLDWQTIHAVSMVRLNQDTAGYLVCRNAYKDDALRTTNPNPEAYRDALAMRAYSRWQLDRDESTFVLTPYFRHTRMNFLQHFLPGTPVERNDQTGFGLQSLWSRTLSADTRLNTGLDAELTLGTLEQFQDQITQGRPVVVATVPIGKHYDYRVWAGQIALFAQAEYRITTRATLFGGVRYEQMRYSYDNRMLDGRTREDGSPCAMGGCRYNRPSDRTDNFDNLSFNLGANLELTARGQIGLRYAEAFRVPQSTELYRLQGNQSVSDINSERLRSLELNWSHGTGRIDYDLSLYLMRKEDVIFRDAAQFYVSDGQTQHRGLELEISIPVSTSWEWGAVGNWAIHSYRSSFDSTGADLTGNRIEAAPLTFGSLFARWQRNGLQLEWESLYTAEYYLDPANAVKYPGHRLHNLRTRYDFGSWYIGARLHNLLDTRYAERADFTLFTQERYFPGRARSLYLSAGMNW